MNRRDFLRRAAILVGAAAAAEAPLVTGAEALRRYWALDWTHLAGRPPQPVWQGTFFRGGNRDDADFLEWCINTGRPIPRSHPLGFEDYAVGRTIVVDQVKHPGAVMLTNGLTVRSRLRGADRVGLQFLFPHRPRRTSFLKDVHLHIEHEDDPVPKVGIEINHEYPKGFSDEAWLFRPRESSQAGWSNVRVTT